MIKTELSKGVFYNEVKKSLEKSTIVPNVSSTYFNSSLIVDRILNLDPTLMSYKSTISASEYNSAISNISSLFDTVDKMSKVITSDYIELSDRYMTLYLKMKNDIALYKKEIDVILGRYCLQIDNSFKNQNLNSRCGHIGGYLTLPYFLNSAKVYDSSAIFTIASDADIKYSNLNNVNYIPLNVKPTFKLLSGGDTITTTVKVLVQEDSYNALYFNIPSDRISKVVTTIVTDKGVVEKTINDGEVFVSFDRAIASLITIKIISNNYSPGKPYSMSITDFILFKNIEFMNKGFFRSKTIDMKQLSNIDGVGLITKNTKQENTNISQYLAITDNEDYLSYNKIDEGKFLDMSSYYLSKSFGIELGTQPVLTIRYNNSDDFEFYKYTFDSTSDIWDLNYSKAQVITGINSRFMTGASPDEIFQNWNKDGNYYTTKLFNFSDNLSTDIGGRSFILNGREVTGKVLIPQGISDIRVHERDVDFNIVPADGVTIAGGEKYVTNFAYFFTGLPEYNSDYTAIKRTKKFEITEQSVLYMNEPFIASGVTVEDNQNRLFRLHLTKNVTQPGTFTIDPGRGVIKIYPYSNTNTVTISYYKSSQTIKPIGVLASDLLTFAPLTSLLDLQIGKTIFSIDGSPQEKVLYIPKVKFGPIAGSANEVGFTATTQLLYNNKDEDILLSTMIELESINKYITPAINKITLSIK